MENMAKYTGTGTGYTVEEALEQWLSSEEFEDRGIGYGHESLVNNKPVLTTCVKKPKIAKRAHTENKVQKGSRKWKTTYTVLDINENKQSSHGTQAEAIARAKELSLETKSEMWVRVGKELIDADVTVAVVTPGKSTPGEWEFTATFRY